MDCAENDGGRSFAGLSDALQGDVNAQYELGKFLEQTERSIEPALSWYKKAALQGHIEAAHRIGILCLKGDSQSRREALFWLEKAAAGGHKESEYDLAQALEQGVAGPPNPERALQWHRIAASHGHLKAQAKITSINNWLDS